MNPSTNQTTSLQTLKTGLSESDFAVHAITHHKHWTRFTHPDYAGSVEIEVYESHGASGTISFNARIHSLPKGKRGAKRQTSEDRFPTLDAALLWAYRFLDVLPEGTTEDDVRQARETATRARNESMPVFRPKGINFWCDSENSGQTSRLNMAILTDVSFDGIDFKVGDMATVNGTRLAPVGSLCAVKVANRVTFGRFYPQPGYDPTVKVVNVSTGTETVVPLDRLTVIGIMERISRNGEIIWQSPAAQRRAFTAAT